MIEARKATDDDLRFVRDSWFESYRRGGFAPEIGFDLFAPGQRNLIAAALKDPFTKVRVAFPLHEPTEILGWVCWHDETVHFVYVKNGYRNMGVATGLLDLHKSAKFYSHQTRAGVQLAKKRQLRFNPYAVIKGNP